MEVVSFGRSTSAKLKEATDDFLDLDEDPKRYLLNFRGAVRRTRPSGDKNDSGDKPSLEEVERTTEVE